MEKLDLLNILEIQEIKKKLVNHPDLLSLFTLVLILANNRLNDEKTVSTMSIEHHEEPELSDHESDED